MTRAPKVLHCVERMHTNAIESWLVRMHQHATATGRAVDWHFHVQLPEPGRLETVYPACAGLVFRSRYALTNWWALFADFRRLCKSERFDVVHVHADLVSAPYILMARLAGVSRTIVHVHNADESVPVGREWKRRALRPVLRAICLALADRIVGISQHTLDTFLSGRRRKPGRDIVHYYGVDPRNVTLVTPDREAVRRTLGLPPEALVLLFAGRMTPEKNPVFAVDVLAELRRRAPRAVAVFAGTGDLEDAVRRRAHAHGLDEAVRLIGWRDDLPAVMNASDWFILPHPEQPKEGFGLAVVEAQLAGLRMLLSTGIPDDPLLPSASFRRLPLSAGSGAWADAAVSLMEEPDPERSAALADLRHSPMEMDTALADLLDLYV